MQFDWTIKVADVAIVVATLLGPVLAVQAQQWLARSREVKQRRIAIFRTLMATRAAGLSANHVEALNSVPIDFFGTETDLSRIVESWKIYIDHLGKSGLHFDVWEPKRRELYIDLLQKISQCLGYSFSRVELEKEFYSPVGHATIENDQEIIRRGFASLMKGTAPLKIEVTNLPK